MQNYMREVRIINMKEKVWDTNEENSENYWNNNGVYTGGSCCRIRNLNSDRV